ncbi:ABC transporter substrate-binding protein [Protofrankia symbiont of Coriaria ruscifolia]|uniref:Aliphatic sulfonates family ABC transporter periplasmic substrate-binding protein n=1 Tax=Candidatus Protofrankia californiensis TaxID=1839754 RepID=A0A1C3PCN1_9ACTN|nr:ABC transporter substrate-binding protein [Protofrankia symbiont of Coriaria ruscifolia]SBW27583.1 aliphatic sulfonates family ABC transporter periplasmic substrate-binding protein [Candidatus Protofrankia californiensis]
MSSRRLWRRITPLLAAGALALAATACSSGGDDTTVTAGSSTGSPTGTLRLGYFPNLTHAPAIYGLDQGIFAQKLGPGVKLETPTFNSGVQAAEALISGALDATYIGPNPAVNAFTKSKGEAVRIIAGATSGGAGLVVKSDITSVEQLRGKTIASPSLGNTQDVALRYYLKQHGLATDKNGGGDVQIRPQDNTVTVDAFKSGAIDGAWVPEPTLSRLISDGGKLLVDEASQWPNGKFVTTLLLVRTDYLKSNPEIVKRLVEANVASIEALNADPVKGQQVTNQGLAKLSGKPLADAVINPAWKRLTFTADPIASSLVASADHATELGLLAKADLNGIFDLTAVNAVLTASGKPSVAAQ